MLAKPFRLRKHADYQRTYKAGRKQHSKQVAYFFALRPTLGVDGEPLRGTQPEIPRVGLTVGKVLGKAVDRNRIKRRLRAAIQQHLSLLHAPVDVILHPRRTVLTLDYATLEREVAQIFRTIQRTAQRTAQHTVGQQGLAAPSAAKHPSA